VIHVDCALRGAHYIPVYGGYFLPKDVLFPNSLDAFDSYYVNRYIHHHSFKLST
ncbi:hypothetical protein SERLA73DRAFT_50652, partial [Serpula lacrymans var. lacrymans S7.3]